jgi:hypothetical protein
MKSTLLKKVRSALSIHKEEQRETDRKRYIEQLIFKAESINEFCAARRILSNWKNRLSKEDYSHLSFVFERRMEQKCLNREHIETYTEGEYETEIKFKHGKRTK